MYIMIEGDLILYLENGINKMYKENKGISIIIPVYNAEKYIKECIDALFAQTFRKNLEYIFIIDKNSTDSSEQIVENAVKNKQNTVILKPKDGCSQGYNRNIAIEYASKDYIGFCDSDDYMDYDFYERLYDYAQICDADIAIGCTLLINDLTKRVFNKAEFPFSIEYLPSKIFSYLRWNTVWDKIYRTKMVKENVDIRFSEGVMHEDNIFVINAVYRANKVITVPGSYYSWRRYPSSVSSISPDSEKYRNDAFIVFSEILDSIEKMKLPLQEKSAIIKQVMPWAKLAYIDEEKTNYLTKRIMEVLGENLNFN